MSSYFKRLSSTFLLYTIIVQIQPWMNVVAYCFGYGTILTKMGRVYKIFNNPSVKKNQIVSQQMLRLIAQVNFRAFIMSKCLPCRA